MPLAVLARTRRQNGSQPAPTFLIGLVQPDGGRVKVVKKLVGAKLR